MFGLFRWLRRRRFCRRPFPEHWLPILDHEVPFYGNFPEVHRRRFRELLKVFAWEKYFIGAKGMEITDEVRVIVSACAVRLVRFLDLSCYDRLTEIVVYPYVYRHQDRDGAVFGEAHQWGTVVLSWPAVVQGLADQRDGLDTAAHEFAHVLDRTDGAFDGTPELRAREDYGPWARVMSRHYLRLQKRSKAERKVMRMYGATDEAEFFAVATEAFFEKSHRMKELTPELYEELQTFYGGDPSAFDDRDLHDPPPAKIYRNDPCPCGSGRKYKKCCGRRP